MNAETQNIIERYEKRKESTLVHNANTRYIFAQWAESERELRYLKILKKRFVSFQNLRLLEIGAGWGRNLYFFKKWGFRWDNIFINELLPERQEELRASFPCSTLISGDACQISEELDHTFDIVFQSTVFTSILDATFKKQLAEKMWALLKPGGIVLWYDFVYDNPHNKDVRGIRRKEIKNLFPEAENMICYRTTLAPPIGRRVGGMYPFFNLFPFLRTHLVVVIEKSV